MEAEKIIINGNEIFFADTTARKMIEELSVNDTVIHEPTHINSVDVVREFLDCALSYHRNRELFYYENSCALNDTIIVDSADRMAIDCSTFVSLCLNGVTFENSRYSLGGDKYNNIPAYPWARNVYDDGTGSFKRYAHQLGKYYNDRGLTFKPLDDFSNVRAGDLIFWEKGVEVEGSFMNISHVAIFIGHNTDNQVTFIDVSELSPPVAIKTRAIDGEFMQKAILCARPDFNCTEYPDVDNIVMGNQSLTLTTDNVEIECLKELSEGYYTFVICADGGVTAQINERAMYCRPLTANLYIANVRVDDTTSNNVYVRATNDTCNLKWICLYKGLIDNPPREYIDPHIDGNRFKIRRTDDIAVTASESYSAVDCDNYVGSNHNEYFEMVDGKIKIKRSGVYLVNLCFVVNGDSYAIIRAANTSNGQMSTLVESRIIGVANNDTYQHVTAATTLKAGDIISIRYKPYGDMTIKCGNLGTMLELIKL